MERMCRRFRNEPSAALTFMGKIIGAVLIYLLAIIVITWIACGCSGMQRKIEKLTKSNVNAGVAIDNADRTKRVGADEVDSIVNSAKYHLGLKGGSQSSLQSDLSPAIDTLGGGEPLIMNAIKEEATGDLVASDNLKPIVVQARFSHVAERQGLINISFFIIIPKELQDPAWQVRFFPKFFWGSDSLRLDKIYITGKDYRDAQLKGYERYNKFLNSIIPDSVDFVGAFTREVLLRRFAERNLKYMGSDNAGESERVGGAVSQKSDSWGITEDEAIEYYTKYWLVNSNNKKKSRLRDVFKKYVKDPLDKEGVRLDTVVLDTNGDVEFRYVQTLKTKGDMRKVKLAFTGGIYSSGRELYKMPSGDSLTFYISSIAQFTDKTPLYKKKIIERRAYVNTMAFIDFKAGRWNIDDSLSNNAEELKRIKGNFDTLLANDNYVIDSIVVTASCSPEGSYSLNTALAEKRAESIKKFFNSYVGKRVEGKQIIFTSRYISEDWNALEKLIASDYSLRERSFLLECFKINDLDKREMALAKSQDYRYLRECFYPLLRRINFNFALHRKGMIKDTIHTTEVDSVYSLGVKTLEERDYKKAIEILRPYRTINTAIAYMCLNYNHSAMDILERLNPTATRNYMMAVLYVRLGEEKKALKLFLSSVDMDHQMKYRGNLDPEISSLVLKYALFKSQD